MSQSMQSSAVDRSPNGAGTQDHRSPDATIDPTDTLMLLSDAHARDILDALGEEALPARELYRRLEVSRATVYRRLERLEAAGLVQSTMSIHPDGHHREQYSRTTNRIQVRFGQDGPRAVGA